MPLKLRLLSALLMSALLSCLMTAWVSWLNLGFGPHYLTRWLQAWASAWPAAFVIVALLAPGVQRLSQRLLTAAGATA